MSVPICEVGIRRAASQGCCEDEIWKGLRGWGSANSGSLLPRCVGQLPPRSGSRELQGPGKGEGSLGKGVGRCLEMGGRKTWGGLGGGQRAALTVLFNF